MGAPSPPIRDKAKQRIRALDLIQKHAGTNAREGQKTKWIIDLVIKVDEDCKQEMYHQQQQMSQLQQQLVDVQKQSSTQTQQLQDQVQSLQETVNKQEAALQSSSESLQHVQGQYRDMQQCLQCAEEAAAAAVTECAGLVILLQDLINQEARVRTVQAHRAHTLRDALLQTQAALRRAAGAERTAKDEREVRLRQRELALTAERAALLDQQAVHAARDDALETLQLKYHLSVCKIKELITKASQSASSAAVPIKSDKQLQPFNVSGPPEEAVEADQQLVAQ